MINIILPVFNNLDMTYDCILSVREHTSIPYDLTVVDNGSSPEFKAPFTGNIPITVIRNENNEGFPKAINQGIKASKGENIILLNNDVIITPGAFDRLAAWLETFDIVGCTTNYSAGIQRVQVPFYGSKEALNDVAEDWAEEHEGESLEVNWIIGFCMAFKREVYDKVGPFDESLWPCSGEEIDFCFRAREDGYRVGIANDVYVHHAGSKTFTEMQHNGQVNYAEVCKRNDAHLAEKWGDDYWHRQLVEDAEPGKATPGNGISLNLGCGYNYQEGYINIDNRAEVKPDLVCDVIEGLPYEDNSVDEVRAYDFLEHIPLGKTIQVITEIWRVLKPGGKFESLTPSSDGRGAFMDPTHVSFWNCHSWLYYSDPQYRNLYNIKANFHIETLKDFEVVPGMGIIHTLVIARAIK